MTPEEIGRILAAAAARDNRTVGVTDVMAWREDIGDLDYRDALAAVSRHYRESTDRLMPAHVRRLVAQIERDRWRAAELRRYQEVAASIAALTPAAPPTRDRKAEVDALIAELRDRLPPGDPAKLRGPAWRARHAGGTRLAPPRPSTPVTSDPTPKPEDHAPKEPHAAPAP